MVKRAIMYLFAAGPLLLLGLIAINSRYNQGHWEFVEYTREADSRIQAFVLPVKESRAHFRSPEHKLCKEHCPAVDAWLEAYRDGELEDIFPPTTASEDLLPVYGRIVRERSNVLGCAMRMAKAVDAQKEPERAAKAFADVIELAEIAKYSEFGAYVDSSLYQLEALQHIHKFSGSLDDTDRGLLLSRLTCMDSSDRSLATTIDHLSDVYRRDQTRRGVMTTMLEAASSGVRLASNVDPTQEKVEHWQELIESDPSVLTLYSQSQLAYLQNVRLATALKETREGLQPVSSN